MSDPQTPRPADRDAEDREQDGRPARADQDDPRRGAGLADPATSPEAAPDDAGA